MQKRDWVNECKTDTGKRSKRYLTNKKKGKNEKTGKTGQTVKMQNG